MRTFCGLTTDGMLDYLAAIYKLDKEHVKVTTSILADHMYVSPAAVSSMLKRLEEASLVERSNVDGIVLTEQGRLAALQLIRRHRLLEVFLMQVMGFDWDQVDMEAHRLEHSISAAFEDRMDRLCGYPTHCPHGDPIPAKDGAIVEEDLPCLVDLSVGQQAVIRRVATGDPRILRYLAQLSLTPGQVIHVVDIAPFNGPVTLEHRASGAPRPTSDSVDTVILGNELARLLFVSALEPSSGRQNAAKTDSALHFSG